ncbi:MAG: TonB-dependent receptor [Terracidiphilus sp.]|jgi:iron complex outermembrane receptor protein
MHKGNLLLQLKNLLLAVCLYGFVSMQAGYAQSTSAPQVSQTVVVLGSPVPTPLAESPSSVLVLPVEANVLSLQSEQDLLRQDSSVFLEQRGTGGGQADIVLRGGTFEQTLVLLNGFRIDDSQTAHHNLDLPVPLDAMDSIEVLHGAGSTLHGVDALSGVVDFLTAAPNATTLRLRAGGGSFGSEEESLLGTLVHKRWRGRLTADRDFSTGFMADRDFRNEDSSLESWAVSRLGVTDLLAAVSDKSFGANQFYGPYESWERTKGWFASARQELGSRTEAAFGYRRHTDEFVLLRDDPSVYENNHIDGSWQTSLRHTVPLASSSVLLLGLEEDGDSIHSNNLGLHARNRGAGYVDLDLRPAKKRWNLSAGVREEIFSGGSQSVLSPHLAGSLRLTDNLKLRSSGGYGFRIPTYTDLYYSDPTTVGNANLKPESAWSGEGGADWTPSSRFSLSATGFYSREHYAIDYVRSSPAAQWQAVNLNGLHFQGVETFATWAPAKSQRIQLAWTGLAGGQGSLNGLQSEYALNYPVANIHATWTASLGRIVTVTNSVAIAKPYQQPGIPPWNASPYPVWNAALTHDMGRFRPFLRLDNLSNTGYQEINGVTMPGRSIIGGVSLWLSR